jgi:hypothetical protein
LPDVLKGGRNPALFFMEAGVENLLKHGFYFDFAGHICDNPPAYTL